MAKTLKKKLTNSEYQKRVDQILGGMHREVSAFSDTSEAAKQARREQGAGDIFWFFRTYLPHYFPQPEAPFHHELIDLVDRRPGPDEVLIPTAIAAPREFAKTTVITFGYVLYEIYYKRRHFILIGSDTEDLASDLTGYLYLEMLYNERLRCDFGEMVRDNWPVDDFVTLNDIRLKARGRGQRIVGRKHKQFRPDLAILDDMETAQSAGSPEQVRKLLDWVKNAVYASLDAQGSLLWIGTIWARKSALETAVLSEDEPYCHWVRKFYQALYDVPDAEGRPVQTSLWPARYSVEKLLKQKRAMGTVAFNLQKMNTPTDEEGPFREVWFRFHTQADLDLKQLITASSCDPSGKQGEANDFKAIVSVGWDAKAGLYRCLHAWIRHASPGGMFGAAYRIHDSYGGPMGIEDNMYEDFLHEAIHNYARKAGRYIGWVPVHQGGNKEARIINTLSYLVEHGKITFEAGHSDQDLLREQMVYILSKTVNDDGPDALEAAVSLLQKQSMAFQYESLGKTAFGRIEGAW
jgi:hypothetical protein